MGTAVLDKKITPIFVSLLISILLLGFKFFLFSKTSSVAMLSDAIESIINVIASGFATLSIFLASKPPDETHPYGHGKIEYFSAGFEGALILFAAYGMISMSYKRLVYPTDIYMLELGVIGNTIVVLCNTTLGLWLIRRGKKEASIALEADGRHILTDAYTSIGVLLSFLLVKFTRKLWIDPIFAILIAINIIYMGLKLVIASFRGLMQAKDPALLEEISRLLKRHRSLTHIDIHRLRAWRAGKELFVDFHLILPMDLPLYKAHQEANRLKQVLKSKFGEHTHVMIQLDPCFERLCSTCQENIEAFKRNGLSLTSTWARTDFTSPKEPQ